MFTRNDWSLYLLSAMGNQSPSQTVISFLNGWSASETLADSGATFNLLNTTEPWPGTTNFNSVGVKNYSSWNDGIQATVATLRNGYYPELEEALRINLDGVLSPPSPEILANLHTWCGGCGYGKDFVKLGSQHAGDIFEYGSVPTQPLQRSTLVATPNQVRAANDCWCSALKLSNGGVPQTGTGIYNAWLQALIQDRQYGPPITHEYASINWDGVPIIVQEFAHARCEWLDGQAHWYSLGGPA